MTANAHVWDLVLCKGHISVDGTTLAFVPNIFSKDGCHFVKLDQVELVVPRTRAKISIYLAKRCCNLKDMLASKFWECGTVFESLNSIMKNFGACAVPVHLEQILWPELSYCVNMMLQKQVSPQSGPRKQ